MRTAISIILFFLPLICAGCAGSAVEPGSERILFVGNSLTFVNDLPRMVEALSSGSDTPVVGGMVAEPNFSLEEHFRGRALREIRRGGWTVVVMQQGPSSLEASREHLVTWSGRMAAEIRAAGAEPVLMTVWPSTGRLSDFPRVIESYRMAASACSCRLVAAGEAWYEVLRETGDVSLYGSDGFHPSEEGTLLAALTVWSTITGRDPNESAELRIAGRVRAERLELLREAVRHVTR